MNKIIKQELRKVRSVELNFDDNSTEIFIPKTIKIRAEALNIGSVYNIKYKDLVYKVEICDIIDNIVKVNGVNINNLSESLYGPISMNEIEVISKD